MKNWLPLELGPLLAMDNIPLALCYNKSQKSILRIAQKSLMFRPYNCHHALSIKKRVEEKSFWMILRVLHR